MSQKKCVTIYGYSDDLVEIENSQYKEDEIDCYDKAIRFYFVDGTPTPVRPSMKHAQSMRRASRPPANRGRERKLRKLSNPRTSLQPLWVALD